MSTSSPVERDRVRHLNDCAINPSGSFVLYWMNNSVRERHNPALEEAASIAARHQKPLRVVYIMDVTAQDGQPLPERHAAFLLEGLADVHGALKKRDVPMLTVAPVPDVAPVVAALAKGAAAVVSDACYLRIGIAARRAASKALDVAFFVVEGDVVVPVETVTDKAEHAARTIRPKITKLMDEYVKPLGAVELPNQGADKVTCDNVQSWLKAACDEEEDIEELSLEQLDSVLSSLSGLDRGSPKVTTFKGGETEAQNVLDGFLNGKMREYGKGRNEPAKQLQSDLSPYLRAGNISPVDITLQTKERTGNNKSALKESESSFLEELVIRRELAVNACWFNPDVYDIYEHIVPNFARESLALHKADKRPKLYSYEELEAAVTDDIYWNAAQLEMVVRGKQHGYMRMYWVKQILGWVEDPAQAMDYALRLNNRWELDAVDPNSYTGVIWCFGLHDQGWKERPIWGKVRYMNDSGLKRKFDMAAYVTMVDEMVSKEGLPAHIVEVRKQHRPATQQTTIRETLKRKRSKSTSPSSKRNNHGQSSKKATRETVLESVKPFET